MDGVPISLEEAASTDGAGWFQSPHRIVLPLMVPGLTVVFIFTFVLQWGNFFVPFYAALSRVLGGAFSLTGAVKG
jgi:multiple sugar transport system permease protein